MIVLKKNNDGTLTLTVDNGDVVALTDLTKKWGLKDEAAVVKFAVGAMLNAKNQKLYVDLGEGSKGVLSVSDELKAHEPQE